jgi:hypothetical protein
MNKMRTSIFIFAIMLTGCKYDPTYDIEKLKAAGYTNAKVTSGSMNVSCGTMPTGPMAIMHREFKAEKNGKKVEGFICASAFGDSIKEK